MRIKLVLIWLVMLLLFSFFMNPFIQADSSQVTGALTPILLYYKDLIAKWELYANSHKAITFLVAILGLVIATIDKSGFNWSKKVVVFGGLIISVLTLYVNTFFDADSKTYRDKSAQMINMFQEVEEMRKADINFDNDDDRKTWLEPIRAKIKQMIALENSICPTKLDLSLMTKLNAQTFQRADGKPDWLNKLPNDPTKLFFIGQGEDRSLGKAKDYAYNSAMRSAIDYLTLQFQTQQKTDKASVNSEELSKYLMKSSNIADFYFIYNKKDTIYNYHLLLSLDKKSADIDMKFFGIQERVDVSKEYSKTIESKGGYYDKRTILYKGALEKARASLPTGDYDLFASGRALRLSGKNIEAIPRLEQVVQRKPDFYFGWYNLALAYYDMNNLPRAEQAYRRAIELEKNDPSLFNSYGYFLYRQKRYDEAIDILGKALVIEPDHPKAKLTIEAARKSKKGG